MPSLMQNQKLVQFAGFFAFLPLSISLIGTPTALLPKQNIGVLGFLASNPANDPATQVLKLKAAAIDAYFSTYDMPLLGTGLPMAQAAAKYGLDWRLLPAIAVRESTGGKNDCKRADNNPFGWASCKVGFKSLNDAIEIVAMNLSGQNPKTARHYDNKTTRQILRAYNPPSVVPNYVTQVLAIMAAIGPAEVDLPADQSNT